MSKVLIIDDDPLVCRFYEKLFRFARYDASFATDGTEGLTKAKDEQPDLILLDILMPKMNGLDVLKNLKRDPLTSKLSVVMLTNLDNAEIVREAIKLGAGGVIVKSQVPPESLISNVESYMSHEET